MLAEIGTLRLEIIGSHFFDLEWTGRFCLMLERVWPLPNNPEDHARLDIGNGRLFWRIKQNEGAWRGRFGPVEWEAFGPASFKDDRDEDGEDEEGAADGFTWEDLCEAGRRYSAEEQQTS